VFASAEPDGELASDPGAEPGRGVCFRGDQPERAHAGPDRFRCPVRYSFCFPFRFPELRGPGSDVDRDASAEPDRGHAFPHEFGFPGPGADSVGREPGGNRDGAHTGLYRVPVRFPGLLDPGPVVGDPGGEPDRAGHPVSESVRGACRLLTI
jgi:hypothetical protein